MGWLQVAGIGASLLGGALGAGAEKESYRAQRKAARLNADLTYDQRMEEIRRLSLEQDYAESLALARIGGSGVEMEGTPQTYLDYLGDEHERRLSYSKTQARKEREAIRAGAPSTSSSNLNAASAMLSGVTAAIGIWNNT